MKKFYVAWLYYVDNKDTTVTFDYYHKIIEAVDLEDANNHWKYRAFSFSTPGPALNDTYTHLEEISEEDNLLSDTQLFIKYNKDVYREKSIAINIIN